MRDVEAQIAERFRLLGPQLNERQRRAFAASEARTFGRGGIAAAARACGLAENTVRKGLRELCEEPLEAGRVRKAGAGRPAVEDSNPELLDALRGLIASDTRGDPERVLLWTSKSSRKPRGGADRAGASGRVSDRLRSCCASLGSACSQRARR